MYGPEPTVLFSLGGSNANQIRKGQLYRLFWAMWMHSGWLHVGLNILCQLQFFWIVEPDWGAIRTFLVFLVAGISGACGKSDDI